MTPPRKAYLVGGGIASLAAAAFLVRDGGMAGSQITILEAGPVMGGSMAGAGPLHAADHGADHGACTRALFQSIPALGQPGRGLPDDLLAASAPHAPTLLVDSRRAGRPLVSVGFTPQDRRALLQLVTADEAALGSSCISDHLPPAFFQTAFWCVWAARSAFQPWHSAVELRRHLHHCMPAFAQAEIPGGSAGGSAGGSSGAAPSQHHTLVLPLQRWLQGQGVRLLTGCTVTDLDHRGSAGPFEVIAVHCTVHGQPEIRQLEAGDLVLLQNGSVTDACSLGTAAAPPARLQTARDGSWALWEKLATGRPSFGRPAAFNGCVAQSGCLSFTATLPDTAFADQLQAFAGQVAGSGGLVVFPDSNWQLSIARAQPGWQAVWGQGLCPDRLGNFVPKAMADCSGDELLQELCGHLRLAQQTVATAHCIPCRRPYGSSVLMPRAPGDRPLPVPAGTRNFAFIGLFVEIPLETATSAEFSVRSAQLAVHQLLGLATPEVPDAPQAGPPQARCEALVRSLP
jgi:oleate hydratase